MGTCKSPCCCCPSQGSQRVLERLGFWIIAAFSILLFVGTNQPWAQVNTQAGDMTHFLGIFLTSNCTQQPCSTFSVWEPHEPPLAPSCLIAASLTTLAMLLTALSLMIWFAPMCCSKHVRQARRCCCRKFVSPVMMRSQCPETICTFFTSVLMLAVLLLWGFHCEWAWMITFQRPNLKRTLLPWYSILMTATVVVALTSFLALVFYQERARYIPLSADIDAEWGAHETDSADLESEPPVKPSSADLPSTQPPKKKKKKSAKTSKTVMLPPL